MTHFSPAERLLQELGVTDPQEIDLEAIAYHVDAQLRFRRLDGCEARIIGVGNRAVITVNSRSSDRRNRFSTAHELGHWHHHRGKCLVCRVDDYQPRTALSLERVADNYAADLLMPGYLFQPLARQQPKLDLVAVSVLADVFSTSQTATAIRLVEGDHSPTVLVYHTRETRKWFTRAPSVPDRWFPRETLDSESYAFDILFGNAGDDRYPHKIGADAWFDRWDATRFELSEQSMRIRDGEIMTLLLLTDPAMLDDEAEPNWKRK